jgi:dihydrofolate reductase
MLVSMIAAMDRRGLIGDGRALPWHLPKDLQRFRQYTWGKPIIMGRATFESIGKPLPGRFNIVLTHNEQYSAVGCGVAGTLQHALSLAEEQLGSSGDETVIIGGGKVYAEAIRRWDRLYLTVVEGHFEGSTFFPVGELLRQRWRPVRAPEMHLADARNQHRHSFHIVERAWDAERPCSAEQDNPPRADTNLEAATATLDLAALLARGTASTFTGGPDVPLPARP